MSFEYFENQVKIYEKMLEEEKTRRIAPFTRTFREGFLEGCLHTIKLVHKKIKAIMEN